MRVVDVIFGVVLVAEMTLAIPDGTVVKRALTAERDPALKSLAAENAKP